MRAQPSSQTAFSWFMHVERETSPPSCYTGHKPIRLGPNLKTSFNPKYLLSAPSPNTITSGVRTPLYAFWGDTIQSIALCILLLKNLIL